MASLTSRRRRALAAAAIALAMAACDAGRLPQQPERTAAPQPRAAPDLALVGVVEAGGASAAIIAERGGTQRTYGIGESVRPGLVVEKIARDGAILAAGETRYRLPLRRNAAAAGRAEESRAVEQKPDNGLSSWLTRNSSADTPANGQLTPYPGGGMRLEGVRPDSPYARLGLQAGDVLLSVNSAPFESPEQLMRLYRSLRSGPQQLEVLRDGRFETLRFGPG